MNRSFSVLMSLVKKPIASLPLMCGTQRLQRAGWRLVPAGSRNRARSGLEGVEIGVGIGAAGQRGANDLRGDPAVGDAVAAIAERDPAVAVARYLADRGQSSRGLAERGRPGEFGIGVESREQFPELALQARNLPRQLRFAVIGDGSRRILAAAKHPTVRRGACVEIRCR